MSRKVIAIYPRRPTTTLDGDSLQPSLGARYEHSTFADPGWTREEQRAWAAISSAASGSSALWKLFFSSLAIHLAVFAVALVLDKPQAVDVAPSGTGTRVTLVQGSNSGARESGDPEPQPYPNRPVDSPVITGPSTSAQRGASERPPDDAVPSTAESTRSAQTQSSATAPLIPATSRQLTKTTQTPPTQAQEAGVGFSPNLRDLLPNSKSEYVASQRRVGTIYGKGAVGGDLDPDADGPVGYRAPRKGEVKVTRYDYAAYFMALDQRFTDAWGGTRVLPPGSTFAGVVGELIEYDIVINRNGSLSKIINVTKQKQAHRSFADVDKLVADVFSNVFPLNPVPNRIREDPLILRKRIRFTGYQYSMF